MRRLELLLATIYVCLSFTFSAEAVPVSVPVPLTSPVFIPLEVNPVVTIGNRTIDFTPNLSQEFIDFLPLISEGAFGNRFTLGERARDGLASITGSFPPSPDPTFANVLPVFPPGTTNLVLFDLVIAGDSGPFFSITLTDLDGDVHPAVFPTSIPEPTTLLLFGATMAGLGLARWRRGKLT